MYRLVPKHALLPKGTLAPQKKYPTGALVLKSTLVPIFFFVPGWWLLGAMLQADRPSVSVVKTIQVYIYRNIAAICTKNLPFMSQKVRWYQKTTLVPKATPILRATGSPDLKCMLIPKGTFAPQKVLIPSRIQKVRWSYNGCFVQEMRPS